LVPAGRSQCEAAAPQAAGLRRPVALQRTDVEGALEGGGVGYDLRTDPGESYNVVDRHPDEGKRLRGFIERWEQDFFANPRGCWK